MALSSSRFLKSKIVGNVNKEKAQVTFKYPIQGFVYIITMILFTVDWGWKLEKGGNKEIWCKSSDKDSKTIEWDTSLKKKKKKCHTCIKCYDECKLLADFLYLGFSVLSLRNNTDIETNIKKKLLVLLF